MIERYFRLSENQTTVRQEFVGGLTTFMTMAYIVVVNPQILSQAGMPVEGVLFATCISAAAASLVMGLAANYPIALAPGMALPDPVSLAASITTRTCCCATLRGMFSPRLF